jgi:hypothetical protein
MSEPLVDLGREIEKHRTAAAELEGVGADVLTLRDRLSRHGLMLTISPMVGDGNASRQIVAIDTKRRGRASGDKRLGDIIAAYMQKDPSKHLTVRECMKAAEEGGYKSASENFYGVMLSLFNHDIRFKKFRQRGSRNVLIGLSDKV